MFGATIYMLFSSARPPDWISRRRRSRLNGAGIEARIDDLGAVHGKPAPILWIVALHRHHDAEPPIWCRTTGQKASSVRPCFSIHQS